MATYTTLQDSDLQTLRDSVSSYMDNGYAPIGEIFRDNTNDVYKIVMQNVSQPLQVNTQVSVGSRTTLFSHNMADKTSWFPDSIRIVDEAVGTGDGVEVNFSLANTFVIDTSHGKITNELYMVPTADQGGSTYIPEVKVNGVVQTERVFGATTGGDFTINYRTGVITFFTPPPNGEAVTCTYFYSPLNAGSSSYYRPSAGKKLVLVSAECLFTSDVVFNDTIVASVYAYNPYDFPNKVEVPNTRGEYKTVFDLINSSNGSLPIIPALGGSPRGFANNVVQLQWNYVSKIELPYSLGAEMRVTQENHNELEAEGAYFTFYGYEIDE